MLSSDQPVPCRSDPDLWFTKPAQAKNICNNVCRLREACLANALELEQQLGTTLRGVHGGLTESERRQLAAA